MLTKTPRRTFTARELATILAGVAVGMVDQVAAPEQVIEGLDLAAAILRGEIDATPGVASAELTDRESASFIGGIVGGLLAHSKPNVVRKAVRWWAKLPARHYEDLKRDTLAAVARARGPVN